MIAVMRSAPSAGSDACIDCARLSTGSSRTSPARRRPMPPVRCLPPWKPRAGRRWNTTLNASRSASNWAASVVPNMLAGGSSRFSASSSSSLDSTPRAAYRRASRGWMPACSSAQALRGGTSRVSKFMGRFRDVQEVMRAWSAAAGEGLLNSRVIFWYQAAGAAV